LRIKTINKLGHGTSGKHIAELPPKGGAKSKTSKLIATGKKLVYYSWKWRGYGSSICQNNKAA